MMETDDKDSDDDNKDGHYRYDMCRMTTNYDRHVNNTFKDTGKDFGYIRAYCLKIRENVLKVSIELLSLH